MPRGVVIYTRDEDGCLLVVVRRSKVIPGGNCSVKPLIDRDDRDAPGMTIALSESDGLILPDLCFTEILSKYIFCLDTIMVTEDN
jgi:hypothetical protein